MYMSLSGPFTQRWPSDLYTGVWTNWGSDNVGTNFRHWPTQNTCTCIWRTIKDWNRNIVLKKRIYKGQVEDSVNRAHLLTKLLVCLSHLMAFNQDKVVVFTFSMLVLSLFLKVGCNLDVVRSHWIPCKDIILQKYQVAILNKWLW